MQAKSERERTWAECGLEEKVERLRRELLDARAIANGANSTAVEAHRLAHEHVHAPSGQVFKPAHEAMNLAGAGRLMRGHDPLR